ncbi:hypothetical protein Ancab_023864, partial [Ancistrocladus abbreviatus]
MQAAYSARVKERWYRKTESNGRMAADLCVGGKEEDLEEHDGGTLIKRSLSSDSDMVGQDGTRGQRMISKGSECDQGTGGPVGELRVEHMGLDETDLRAQNLSSPLSEPHEVQSILLPKNSDAKNYQGRGKHIGSQSKSVKMHSGTRKKNLTNCRNYGGKIQRKPRKRRAKTELSLTRTRNGSGVRDRKKGQRSISEESEP